MSARGPGTNAARRSDRAAAAGGAARKQAMTQAPAHIAADVLVIGAGGAGMYAALAAAEAGAGRIVLADRNMVGRGGATVMAQMTVAAASARPSLTASRTTWRTRWRPGAACAIRGSPRCSARKGRCGFGRWTPGRSAGRGRAGASPRSPPRPPAPALLLCGHPQHRPRRCRHAPPPGGARGRDQAPLRPRRDRPGDG